MQSADLIKQIDITIDGVSYPIRCPRSRDIENVAREVFVKKQYPVLPFLQNQPGVVLDVGANVGCSCVWFYAAYPLATIYAFEPDPGTFEFLAANTSALDRIHCMPIGCYIRAGRVPLYLGNNSSATNSMSAKGPESSSTSIEIELQRLSTFVTERKLERISILKIDTEGSEIPILRDVEHLLDRIDAIHLEYHSEVDRLEMDHLLHDQFCLMNAVAQFPHRGTLGYVSKKVIAERTRFNDWAIPRPAF